MRRRIAFANLLIAFFASNIVVFGAPKRDFFHLRVPPNEIIVKFKNAAATNLEEKTSAGLDATQLELSASLDKLNKKYHLRSIKPLFKNFKAHRKQLKNLLNKDKALLTKREQHILQRLRRSPDFDGLGQTEKAIVPALDRIYKLRFALTPDESIEEVLAEYKNDPSIEYAELNHIVSTCIVPDDPLYPLQWPLDNIGQDYPASGDYKLPPGTPDCDIDAPQAWDVHTGSPEVTVAVVDTGVDYSHRDLQANMWINSDEIPDNGVDDDGNGYIDDIYGYDFLNIDKDPNDDNGHGTHCSGTIAAGGNNGLDIAGVCWNVKIMALKFLDENGEGFTSDAAIAIYYAIENGADVISNSWSGPYYSELMEEMVNYAQSRGVIMVAAAGNNDHDSPHYPAFYEYVIAVAATDSNDQKATFSNYGSWVDISAPGVDVLSLRANQTSIGTTYDDYTTIASGTSMACPHVAAVIALMISKRPDDEINVINARLLETADDISAQNPGFEGLLGAGRVNAYKAVRDEFEGIITFDSNSYSCDDVVGIEVIDFDLSDQTTLPIIAMTDGGDLEIVNVAKDPNYPWFFAGTINTSSEAVTIQDGTLQLMHGQIITARYYDTYEISSQTAETTATATADCEGPQIFNVQVEVPGPEPTVIFQTNEPATARVLYSLACGDVNVIEANSLILTAGHSIKLTEVSPKTQYFFIIEATDAVGNKTLEDNNNGCFTFTTDEGPREIYVPAEYPTIQEAVRFSWNGGTVRLADGTYKGQGNRDIDFLGRAITVRSENGPQNCIIDPQGSENNPHRAFYFHNKEGPNSVLIGLSIINGYQEAGGGIYCEDSSPTLINCKFSSNSAEYWGGAINIRRSSSTLINCSFSKNEARWGGSAACTYCYQNPKLVNCTFSDNSARYGGGLYNDHSNTTVTDSNFSGNSARYGASVYNISGVDDQSFNCPELNNCTFSENSSSSYGGGILNFESSPTVNNCKFTGNSALHYGGAIYNSEDSNPVVADCTFSGNSAGHGGAIHSLAESRSAFTNCTITGNSARWDGGGLYGGLGLVSNCTIQDNNTVYAGGGLYEYNGTITNCLISGNSAGSFGGALYSCQGPIISCTITDNSTVPLYYCSGPIINCIIWNENPNNSPAGPLLSGSSIPLYSCVQGGSDGIGCINLNPCFINAQNSDYHLLPGSPCKDAGSYYYCMNLPGTDREGATRMAGGQIDMGCYEIGGTPDIDGDWLGVTQECLYSTDPNLPDTDGDGLADGLEILAGTNPLDADPPRIWQVPADSTLIQQALFFSRPGETIILAEGTYYENIYLGGRNITLTGTDPNDPKIVAATIINGDTDRAPETISGRVINLAGTEDANCHIRALTITGGYTNAGGGGIYGAGSRICISNCIIYGNTTLNGGGGLYDCDGIIKNCTVTENLARDGGGLCYCNGPITNCTITMNLADDRGGGMFDCGGENTCDRPHGCLFTIVNCNISDNMASSGGGIYNNITSPTLTNCTLSGNAAQDFGGGMYNGRLTGPVLTNCMLIGNSANYGGAIYNYERTSPILTNCTFAKNSAPNGNGLACDSPDQLYPSYLQITNSILWDDGDQIWNNDNSVIIINYSNIRGGWIGKGNIDTNPLFSDANNGDYRLSACSPCIDAGTDAGVYEDIEGDNRPFDFPGVDNNGKLPDFDMGADEAAATIQGRLIILPRTINRGREGEKISSILHLPESIAKDDIDAHEPLVLYPGPVKAIEQHLIPPAGPAQSNLRIHAVFDKTELLAPSPDNGDTELIVIGRFVSGKYFYGTDTVRVISPGNNEGQ
jgi:predicted outer membrane repeat protein